MLSKNKIKEIKSLESKKNRTASGLFIAEGTKLIEDLLDSGIRVEWLIVTPRWTRHFTDRKPGYKVEITEVSEEEITRASLLRNPQGCLALCRIPHYTLPDLKPKEELIVCLDDVQDPGNLGTIIRLSDWFGINDIICSPSTADVYNPKVVQSSMGAIARVRVHYSELEEFLGSGEKSGIPVYGTFMEGENIYTSDLTSSGIVVLGNEGNGIHRELVAYIGRRITIPDFHRGSGPPDSLNVSLAAAIVISEFRRRSV